MWCYVMDENIYLINHIKHFYLCLIEMMSPGTDKLELYVFFKKSQFKLKTQNRTYVDQVIYSA